MFAKRLTNRHQQQQQQQPLNCQDSSQSITNFSSYNNDKNGENINTSDSISSSSYVANFYPTSMPSSLSFHPHLNQQRQKRQAHGDRAELSADRSHQPGRQVRHSRQQQHHYQQQQIRAPMLVPMMIDDELDLIDDQNGGLDFEPTNEHESLAATEIADSTNNNIGVYQALSSNRHYPLANSAYHHQQHHDRRRQQFDCVDSIASSMSHHNLSHLDRQHLDLARHNRSQVFSGSKLQENLNNGGQYLSHASGFLHDNQDFHDQPQQHHRLFAYQLAPKLNNQHLEQTSGEYQSWRSKRNPSASRGQASLLHWPNQSKSGKPNRTNSGDSGGPLVGPTSSSSGGGGSSSSSNSSSDLAGDQHQNHKASSMSQQQSGRHHQHSGSRRPNSGKNIGQAPSQTPRKMRHKSAQLAIPQNALGCCGKLAKLLLFITNLIFWSAGFALGAWGILSLVDDHKYNLSQLLVFEPNSRMSLFQLLAWSFITLGCAAVLVGFCGCSAILKNNRWILGLYIFLILAIFALDLATGLLAIIFQERLVANVRLRLANKLRSDYGVQASFTAAVDYIQTRFECCGLEGHFDYDQSLWRLQRLGGFEATVARTCCHLRNTFDDQAHINPRPVNESMCQSTDMRFHQSYRYRKGCLDDLERMVRQKIWTFTIGCAAVGAIILLSLIFATCFCRSIQSRSRKGSSSSQASSLPTINLHNNERKFNADGQQQLTATRQHR